MYRIVKVTPTDYDPAATKDELQALADDLNTDAIDADDPDRWIIIDEQVLSELPTPSLA